MTWKLKKLKQCAKCPWKVSTNPHDIRNGYSEEKHCALEKTIALPGAINFPEKLHIMACHESTEGNEIHCIGWRHNQLGEGNNIPLRMKVRDCENISDYKVVGPQHPTFKDTLPNGKDKKNLS